MTCRGSLTQLHRVLWRAHGLPFRLAWGGGPTTAFDVGRTKAFPDFGGGVFAKLASRLLALGNRCPFGSLRINARGLGFGGGALYDRGAGSKGCPGSLRIKPGASMLVDLVWNAQCGAGGGPAARCFGGGIPGSKRAGFRIPLLVGSICEPQQQRHEKRETHFHSILTWQIVTVHG